MSHAILRVLQRVVENQSGSSGRGSVTERLLANRAELFRGVAGTTLTVVRYWMEATKRILNDIDCTLEPKLKGIVSLLKDEAYHWWQSTLMGTQAECQTWEYFQETFQKKLYGYKVC